ncbi:MAG TPA: hypothetical protein VFJ47_05625, partial [Terriglobales bacterium]|nr:hypothetical protein [Terriglobales bacterium]
MTKRVLLVGLIGGLGMFVWSAIAHMVLPLGEAGVREVPNEQALLGSMHTTLGEKSGMYLFPAMGVESGQKASMQEYDQKL